MKFCGRAQKKSKLSENDIGYWPWYMNVLDSRCSVLTSLVSVAPPESSAKSGNVAPPNLSTRYILNLIRSYNILYIISKTFPKIWRKTTQPKTIIRNYNGNGPKLRCCVFSWCCWFRYITLCYIILNHIGIIYTYIYQRLRFEFEFAPNSKITYKIQVKFTIAYPVKIFGCKLKSESLIICTHEKTGKSMNWGTERVASNMKLGRNACGKLPFKLVKSSVKRSATFTECIPWTSHAIFHLKIETDRNACLEIVSTEFLL